MFATTMNKDFAASTLYIVTRSIVISRDSLESSRTVCRLFAIRSASQSRNEFVQKAHRTSVVLLAFTAAMVSIKSARYPCTSVLFSRSFIRLRFSCCICCTRTRVRIRSSTSEGGCVAHFAPHLRWNWGVWFVPLWRGVVVRIEVQGTGGQGKSTLREK